MALTGKASFKSDSPLWGRRVLRGGRFTLGRDGQTICCPCIGCRSSRPAGYLVTLQGVSLDPVNCRDIYAIDRHNPSGPPIVVGSARSDAADGDVNATFDLNQWRSDTNPSTWCSMRPVGLTYSDGAAYDAGGCSGTAKVAYDLVVNFRFDRSGGPGGWPIRIGYAQVADPPLINFGYIAPAGGVLFFEGTVGAGDVCARTFTVYNQITSADFIGGPANPAGPFSWKWLRGYGGTATFTPYF